MTISSRFVLRAQRLLTCAILLACTSISWADYEAGLKAAERKDFATAFNEMKTAAESGDSRAYLALGTLYQNGMGTAANPAEGFGWLKKAADLNIIGGINGVARAHLLGNGVEANLTLAKQWAAKTADAGNSEGEFLLYAAILQSSLSYLEGGKASKAKYDALANRPASERRIDIIAYESLYRSAGKGYAPAVSALTGFYADQLGEDNNKKFIAGYAQLVQKPKTMEAIDRMVREMLSIGNTYASYKIMFDAQRVVGVVAVAKAGLTNPEKARDCDPKSGKLVKLSITTPINNAEYLPLSIPELAKAVLLKGSWQEEWTYDFCGKQVPLTVSFQADGFGGAHFQATGK